MGAFTFAPGIPDAPADTKLYGRKDEAWSEVPSGGGGGGSVQSHGIVGNFSNFAAGVIPTAGVTSFNVSATNINQLTLNPIRIGKNRTIRAAAFPRNAVSDGNVMRIAIYSVAASGLPGVLLKTFAEMPIDTAGVKLSADTLAIPAGDYWVAWQCSIGTNVLTAMSTWPAYGDMSFTQSDLGFNGSVPVTNLRYIRGYGGEYPADLSATALASYGVNPSQPIIPWFKIEA